MSFQRTATGLSNLHLFLGVDLVVFVEGGDRTFSLQEICAGQYNKRASDLRFWELLFEAYSPAKRCHFRPVGGKGVLQELAAQILAGAITHVVVCMDRDYDHLRGIQIRSAGVLYTFGYSWENDVWTRAGVLSTFQQFSTLPKHIPFVQKEIDEQFSSFERMLHWPTHAWFLVLNCGTGSTVNWLRILRHKIGSPPTIDPSAARSLIHEAAKGRHKGATGVHRRIRLRSEIDCNGHLLGAYGFHLTSYLVRKYCKIRSFPKDAAIPVAINTVSKEIPANAERNAHYAAHFAALP